MSDVDVLIDALSSEREREGEGGVAARLAARALTRELVQRARRSGRERGGASGDDAARRACRAMCSPNAHARAQDELARAAGELVRSGAVGASELASELASGTASARTSGSARALSRAIVEVCCESADGELKRECSSASAHPMTRALKAHRDAGAGLLEATASKLASGSLRDFEAMRRFISCALLEHPAPVPRSSFPMLLHARLMAVASGHGESASAILELCARALGWYRSPTSESRAWIASAASELIDTIECRLYDVGDAGARDVIPLVAEGLSRQTRAAALSGDSVMPFMGALKRLSELGDVSACRELIPCLSLVQSVDESAALLALMAPHFPADGLARSLSSAHASSALMLPKESGARLALSLSMPRRKNVSTSGSIREKIDLGTRTQDGFMHEALFMTWNDQVDIEKLRVSIRNDGSKSCALELACLAHPSVYVRECAAEKLAEKLGNKPVRGMSDVTMTLLHLRMECERSADDDDDETAKAVLQSLRALAAGASDFMAAPAVLRAIAPLMNAKAAKQALNPRLHALALRLLADMWIHNREFSVRLRGALEDAASSTEPAVVIGCASAVVAAAKAHPFRAAELVIPIQECLKSDIPPAQALALEAIDSMCEQEALDFLPAFKVVTRHIPTLPQHPLVAQKWIRLLRHGGQDASDFPEAAATFVDIIWSAIKAGMHPTVRSEAWNSLSSYDPEFISELGVPTSSEIASSALSENMGEAFDRAVFVLTALTRREVSLLSRTVMVSRESQQASHPPPSDPLVYKVTQVLPKKLLDVHLCAGARLLLFRPQKGNSDPTKRAESYRAEFDRYIKEISWGDWWHADLTYHSWGRFAQRWFDAEVSATRNKNAIEEVYSEVRASMIAKAMKALEEVSTPDELQNIVLFLATPTLMEDEDAGARLVDFLLTILQDKMTVVGAERGLCIALGVAAGSLQEKSKEQLILRAAVELIQRIRDCRIDGASTMGAAAVSLGLLCQGLAAHRDGVSSSTRAKLVEQIAGILLACLDALGAPSVSADTLGIRPSTDAVLPPNGDVAVAVIGVCGGLSRAVSALDDLDDDERMRRTLALIHSFIAAVECGHFPHSVALPVALKSLLDRKHTVENEDIALRAMESTTKSTNSAIRVLGGVIMGVMLDYGCAIQTCTCQNIASETISIIRNENLSCYERCFGVLCLASALGAPWDGYSERNTNISTSAEDAVFTAPLFWGGDKGKIEAKAMLKTIESIALDSNGIQPRALRDLGSWALAALSDRTAQIAVTVSSRRNESKASVPGGTVIGKMMEVVLTVTETHPTQTQIREAAMALNVLLNLTRLPSAAWSNALGRWWRVATSDHSEDAKKAVEALQIACIRMCHTHPDMSVGRNVLESLAALSQTDFLNLSDEAQQLAMFSAPTACALKLELGVSVIQRFVEVASLSQSARECMVMLWKGLSTLPESAVAVAAVRALTSRLHLADLELLDQASTCIKQFASSVLRDEAIKSLAQDVKPIVCAQLFKAGQVPAETLTSLALWPKETRMITLKATARNLADSTTALRAQMVHEAANLVDDQSIPCLSILAAAWGPTSSLLPMMSVEQCVRALPYTLNHLLQGDLSGLMDSSVSSVLRNMKGSHSRVAIDALLELRNSISSALYVQMIDAIAF